MIVHFWNNENGIILQQNAEFFNKTGLTQIVAFPNKFLFSYLNKVTNKNKFHSLRDAFLSLGINATRINQTVTIDGSSTASLTSTRCFLVGTDTEEPSKPVLFVRKKLDDITSLGGVLYDNGEKPESILAYNRALQSVHAAAGWVSTGVPWQSK